MKKITILFVLLTVSIGYSQIDGTWKMAPQAGAMSVGPTQGSGAWFTNSIGDVTTRACFFDDEYIFNTDGSFSNVLGTSTWLEGWQGTTPDACGTPVAPHNGSNAATYNYNAGAGTVTLTGVGAYLGLAKVYNGGELTSPSGAPASITYIVTALTANSMTLDISIGGGWWRFVMQKQGVAPTCTDGIQNGDETGVDCGGSCPNACLSQIDFPVTFEGSTTDFTVTDFGGNVSTLIVDPTSSGNMVIQTTKTAGAQLWAGTTIGTSSGFATNLPFSGSSTKMYVRVWSPDAGIPVRLKVEDANDNTHTCETETLTTVAMGWEYLEFDFSNEAPGTATLANGLANGWIYNMASIFFNFGTDGATAGEKIYYFDDVSFATSLSIDDLDNTNFNVYPNPTQNVWKLQTNNQNITKIDLYDMLGKLVLTISPNTNEVKIDASSLVKGLYFARISSNNGVNTVKLIKN